MSTLPFPDCFTPHACRLPLDTSAEAFGELRDSADLAHDGAALRARLAEDGYLLLRGYLDREQVLAARGEVTAHMAAAGALDLAHPVMDAVAAQGNRQTFSPDVAAHNAALTRVLYAGPMMAFYARLLGGPVRHFDYTWLRTMMRGPATKPHCDLVYMGRGTQRLYTAWTPLGNLPLTMGGLMVLERSHLHADKLRHTSTATWTPTAPTATTPCSSRRAKNCGSTGTAR